MVRVSAAEYDTLSGLSVDENGQLTGSLGGITIALTQLPGPRQLPRGPAVHHRALDGVAVGGRHRVGHRAPNLQRWYGHSRIQHLPRPRLGGPPGGHLPDGREHDDRDGRHSGDWPAGHLGHPQRRNQHAAVPELREQAGGWGGPGRVLQQLAVRPVGCSSAQPRVTPVPRASRIAVAGSPGRGGTSREWGRPGASECRRGPGSPRVRPTTRDRLPAGVVARRPAEADVGMSCRHGRM